MVALAQAFVLVRPDTSDFGRELKLVLRRVDVASAGRDAGSKFQSGFGDRTKKAIGRGLAATGIAAGAAFGAALTKGFGRLSAIENAEAKLTGLGHSAKTVDKIMTNALASVKGTAFGLDEAATVAATAVASGIKPGQNLQRTLKLVADAATIGGSSLADMGGIFAQVASSNKIQGDTINQLNERGIPILKLLADVTGKSQGEVSALASKGKIDFATFQKAMEKGLGGAALDSGKTATGAFKNMGAAISRVGAALLKGVFPQLGAGFGTITKFLDDITPAAGRFGVAVGGALSKAGAGLTAFRNAFKTGKTEDEGTWLESIALAARRVSQFITGQAIPAIQSFFTALRTGQTEDEGTPIERLALTIRDTVLPALAQVGGFIRSTVLPALKSIGTFILTVLLPAWAGWYGFLIRQMMPILKQVGGFVRDQIVPAFKVVVGFIISEVVPGFLSIVETVKGLIRVVAPIVGQLVGVILGKFKEMRPEIKSIWGSVKEIITGVMFIVKEVISSVTTIIKLIWDRWGTQIKAIVGTVFGAIFKIIAGLMKAIAGVIKLVVALIKGDWKGAWNAVKQIFSGVWQAIKAILTITMGQIIGFFSTRLAQIRTSWSGFWTRIKDGARSAMDWVHTKITGVLDKIKGAFSTAKTNIKKTWDGVKTVVSAPITWVKDNVYNKPLVPLWNRVAKLVGGTELKAYARGGIAAAERYANGGTPFGVRPGYTPGKDTHPILVGGGEAIMRPEWTRAAGADYVNAANAAARRGVPAARRFIGSEGLPPGFAGGGIVGWIKDKLGSAGSAISGLAGKMKDWVLGGLHKAASALLGPLKGFIDRNMPASGVGRTVGGLGTKAINLVLDKIKGVDVAPTVSPGAPGGNVGITSRGMAATMAAMRQHGARSFTTYPGHHPSMAKARDVTPHNWAMANAARASSSVWYVIYRMMIASKNKNNTWQPYHPTNFRGDWRHTRHVHVGWFDKGGIVPQLAGGGIVKGGRGGLTARIGEGRFDELVTPLRPNWKAAAAEPSVIELGPRSIAAIASALTVEIDGKQVARAVRYQGLRGTS